MDPEAYLRHILRVLR
ncbi:TPA: hypothetical protein ACGP0H_004950 [Escherichia coli]